MARYRVPALRYPVRKSQWFLMLRWALDLLHGIERQGRDSSTKFQSETAEDGVDGLQVCEIHISWTIGRWWGQAHRPPPLAAGCEDTGERGSVDNWQIGPVLYVVSEVVHIYRSRIQGMAEAYDEAVATALCGIEDAV